MHDFPKVSIGAIGQLKSVTGVRLTQRLFEHDLLDVSVPLISLPDESVLLSKPEKLLQQKLTWKAGDPFTWKGVVVSAASSLDTGMGAQARITALSPGFYLDNGTGYRSFDENADLEEVFSKLLKPYTSKNLIKRTGTCKKHEIPFAVQYGENDSEFLMRLCNQYGEWVYWTGKELHVGKLEGKAIELLAKRDLKNLESSVRVRPLGFQLSARDYLADETQECSSGDLSHPRPVGFELDALSGSESMMCEAPLKVPRLRLKEKSDKLLKELAVTRKLSESKGLVVLSASSEDPRLSIGKKITVKYAIDREGKKTQKYGGEYVVIRAVHEMSSKGAYQNYIEAVPAETGFPPLNANRRKVRASLDTAQVVENIDPENLGRVKVRFVWQKEGQSSPWIRVAMGQAGKERGLFFVPEKDDEVLVGFEAGNPERPVVIGSLYHGRATGEYWKNGENLKKGLRTTSGNEILFFDEKAKERIEVKSKNSEFMMSLSLEENGKVRIKGNKIQIEAGSEVNIKGTKVEISADAEVSIKGGVVKLN